MLRNLLWRWRFFYYIVEEVIICENNKNHMACSVNKVVPNSKKQQIQNPTPKMSQIHFIFYSETYIFL